MLVEFALYKIIPGKEPQALGILEEQAAAKRRLEGCRDARVLSGSRSVASPSTDPELILTLAEFDDAAAYAAYRDLVAEDEKKAGKAALTGLTAAPPMVGVFE
jgi:heme-degrading monooxygenase HmoA